MTYPQTGSTLSGTVSTGLSTQIVVKVDNTTVGAIQRLTVNQNRALERVKELGLDGILEIVPRSPTEFEISVTRIVFDKLRLPEAFARGFINIKAQMIPFDIEVIDNTGGENNVIHKFTRCWFTRYNPTYNADNFIISEEATIWCEDISSTIGTGSDNAAVGGARGIPFAEYTRERSTDRGEQRGTMDQVGIFDITKAAFE